MWYVYICDREGQLRTGLTTTLPEQMARPRARLLYYEEFSGKQAAVRREREIKGWRREKKMALVDGKK
ncbi:MAG: GIY-YIG nuclease family protein [Desulfosudaceae bacterium]